MPLLRRALVFALFAPALVLAQPAAVTTSASGSFIRIASITPAPETVLRAGERVTFEVDVEYTLAAPQGYVSLFVQRGDGAGPPLGEQTREVASGPGRIRLQSTVEVSGRGALLVFTPLNHRGDGGTSVVDMRSYRVQD